MGKAVYAEEWYSIAEEPGGKTTQPPKQLEKYPLGQNTEKHFPPNMEFTLWTQDETFFKPEEEDKIEVKKVIEKEDGRLLTEVITGKKLMDRKGVNLPDTILDTSPLTEKDRKDLDYALSIGVDWVALSFVQKPEDIQER